MAWFRQYVDKLITAIGGGEHSRSVDLEAADAVTAEAQLALENDEQRNSTVELGQDPN